MSRLVATARMPFHRLGMGEGEIGMCVVCPHNNHNNHRPRRCTKGEGVKSNLRDSWNLRSLASARTAPVSASEALVLDDKVISCFFAAVLQRLTQSRKRLLSPPNRPAAPLITDCRLCADSS